MTEDVGELAAQYKQHILGVKEEINNLTCIHIKLVELLTSYQNKEEDDKETKERKKKRLAKLNAAQYKHLMIRYNHWISTGKAMYNNNTQCKKAKDFTALINYELDKDKSWGYYKPLAQHKNPMEVLSASDDIVEIYNIEAEVIIEDVE